MSMRMSEVIAELAKALAAAQGEIVNPLKDIANPFFKSKYADLAGVLDVVRPVFAKHGLAISQHPSMENGIVTVESLLTHASGQWILSAVSAPMGKQDAQGMGSAVTYCRRYALAAIAGVAQDDDDGNSISQGKGLLKPNSDAAKQAEYSAKFDQHTVDAWLGILDGKDDLEPDWWPGNKADIMSDCGEAGAKVVYAHCLQCLAKLKSAK